MLSDVEVVQYSRQILLGEVGGRGQEKLLAARVRLQGSGEAIAMASRYLAASGMKVGSELERWGGFPLRKESVETSHPENLVLMEPPYAATELPGVVIGTQEERCGLVFWTMTACTKCAATAAKGFARGVSSALSPLAGALTAWVLQRLWLGISEELGGLWISPPGKIERLLLPSCHHEIPPKTS